MLTIKILFTINLLEKKKKTIHSKHYSQFLSINNNNHNNTTSTNNNNSSNNNNKMENKASYHSNLTITYNFNFNVIASCSLVFRRLFATEKHMRKYKLLKCHGP